MSNKKEAKFTPLLNNENRANYSSYRDYLNEQLSVVRAEYLAVNQDHELSLWGVSLAEMAKKLGSPLEIICIPTIILRANQISAIIQNSISETGYVGGYTSFYASKANPTAPYIETMIRQWNAVETSSATDAWNLLKLAKKGKLPKNFKIACNGPKPLPSDIWLPDQRVAIKGLIVDDTSAPNRNATPSYLELINQIASMGVDITPIVDSQEELDYLCQDPREIKVRKVGLRLKVYGVATNLNQLEKLQSRHGMDVKTLAHAAERIDKTKHLELTTFHAMISAAGAPPMEDFINSLLYTAKVYFELKKQYPTLSKFNIGGGIPAIGFTDFDHQYFFKKLFSGIKDLAKRYKLDEPEIQFEMGTPIAKEAGMVVYKVVNRKINSIGKRWAMLDGSLMEDFPDMKVVDDKTFPFWAVNDLNRAAESYTLGDMTCDGDGCYPQKGNDGEFVLLPTQSDNDLYIAGLTAGAYQETLTGFGGVGHCALAEPDRVVMYVENGKIRLKRLPKQTAEEIHKILGF